MASARSPARWTSVSPLPTDEPFLRAGTEARDVMAEADHRGGEEGENSRGLLHGAPSGGGSRARQMPVGLGARSATLRGPMEGRPYDSTPGDSLAAEFRRRARASARSR